MLGGELEVTCDGEVRTVKTGEAIRFRGDRPHKLLNTSPVDAHATMVLVLYQLAERGRG
jgi:quercetin dioxygenase-like cupin family protein